MAKKKGEKMDSLSDMIINKIKLQINEDWNKDAFKKEFRGNIEKIIKEWMI